MLALLMAWACGVDTALTIRTAMSGDAGSATAYGALAVMWGAWAILYHRRDRAAT